MNSINHTIMNVNMNLMFSRILRINLLEYVGELLTILVVLTWKTTMKLNGRELKFYMNCMMNLKSLCRQRIIILYNVMKSIFCVIFLMNL
ncbi:hypothetical protein PVIIG_05629 [Plasmodium vivax India VII]|uniref:Uncharacterized protein n=1 Tax=Plasmodium vivax India VII TaxID=1077284 RepID=A0A0J9S5U4_PLAVI|nr:hypothetical protein PVIIG_05629 [Plasmodium vivax India VII]